MSDTSQGPPVISPKALSDALSALGTYAEPPTDEQLAAAEDAMGVEGVGGSVVQRFVRFGAGARDDR